MDAEVDLTAASREDLLGDNSRFAAPCRGVGSAIGRRRSVARDAGQQARFGVTADGGYQQATQAQVAGALDIVAWSRPTTWSMRWTICPDCGTSLTGGWVHRTREVIEIPAMPVQVTQHVVVARTCRVMQEAAGAEAGAGRRGGGPSAVGYQPCEPGGNAQGACQAADRHDPVVPADGSRIGPERQGR